MNQETTFLQRVRPAIDGLPDGPDKDALLALAQAQDASQRRDLLPKQRAQARRSLRQLVAGARSTRHTDIFKGVSAPGSSAPAVKGGALQSPAPGSKP